MSEIDLLSEGDQSGIVPNYIRADGEIRASFVRLAKRTALAQAFERGGLRLRCPNMAHRCEAVLINTAGGIAGGDRARYAFAIGDDARVTLTTQAAEKVYRTLGPISHAEIALSLASSARLEWIPQETILYDGARFNRKLEADLASDAALLLVESVVFGRLAKGESVTTGLFRDRWRIRRQSRLIFAEEAQVMGNIAQTLDRPAVGGGARMIACMLYAAQDAESYLAATRSALASSTAQWGASAWNGVLLVRILSPSPDRVRSAMIDVLKVLRGCDAPRVWT
jgi:urease accessory protein